MCLERHGGHPQAKRCTHFEKFEFLHLTSFAQIFPIYNLEKRFFPLMSFLEEKNIRVQRGIQDREGVGRC